MVCSFMQPMRKLLILLLLSDAPVQRGLVYCEDNSTLEPFSIKRWKRAICLLLVVAKLDITVDKARDG